MTDSPKEGISVRVGRNMVGQINAGDGNIAVWNQAEQASPPRDVDGLKARLDELRELIGSEGGDNAEAALAKLDELEEALLAETPDLATMEHVRGWFTRKFPRLAAAVGRVIVSPAVTSLVAAAGDELSAEFTRRLQN
ncbi:hypothetical protein ACQPYK_30205 [Streptosporangium sp. CA-135522]|uniref:hypothetical protein n=1 Tax=Streptosporangium sp. CA-135522 TaxID=3240072 RepID=UPI003D92A4C0